MNKRLFDLYTDKEKQDIKKALNWWNNQLSISDMKYFKKKYSNIFISVWYNPTNSTILRIWEMEINKTGD